MEQNNITISMEEYKELLIIKGKYEELKLNSITIKPDETTSPYNPFTNPYGGPFITYCCNERK